MAIGGILAQMSPYGDRNPGDVLLESYAAQAVALLLVLVAVFVLVKVLPGRTAKEGRPEVPIPDWYPDPWGEPYQRWWNGATWTAAVRPYPWPGPPPGPGGYGVPGPPASGSSAPPNLPPGPGTGWPPS